MAKIHPTAVIQAGAVLATLDMRAIKSRIDEVVMAALVAEAWTPEKDVRI